MVSHSATKIFLERWRENFKYISNPIASTPLDKQKIDLGGGYHLSTNVFLAVKTLKAAGCSEI